MILAMSIYARVVWRDVSAAYYDLEACVRVLAPFSPTTDPHSYCARESKQLVKAINTVLATRGFYCKGKSRNSSRLASHPDVHFQVREC